MEFATTLLATTFDRPLSTDLELTPVRSPAKRCKTGLAHTRMPGSESSMTASEHDFPWVYNVQPTEPDLVNQDESEAWRRWAERAEERLRALEERVDGHGPDHGSGRGLDARPRRLGITWKDLTVKAVAADATIHDNFTSQYNPLHKFRDARRKPPLKTILDNIHGCVKPGEMLLVLGRPESGCTTLLNVLANRRRGYTSIDGEVYYGTMAAADAGQYRGQIVMNTEDELFFPSLTVDQTMDFATRLKIPFDTTQDTTSRERLRKETRDSLLQSMGIDHTHTTKLGNEFIRGVSGGERKRVSIVECMATRGSVYCWDNSTRGLDASKYVFLSHFQIAIRMLTS
jgi:ATPase subunit of ABC transporter with duplicated ATPase domains